MIKDKEEVKISTFKRVYSSGSCVYVGKKSLSNNVLILGCVPNRDVQKAKRRHAKEEDSKNDQVMF